MRRPLTLIAAYLAIAVSCPCVTFSAMKSNGGYETFGLLQEPLPLPSDQMRDVVKTKRPPDSLRCSGYVLVDTRTGQEYRGWLYRIHPDAIGVWCGKGKLVVIPESQMSGVHKCKTRWRQGATYGSIAGVVVGWGIVFAMQHDAEVESPRKAQSLLDDAAFTLTVATTLGAFFGGLLGSMSYTCSGSPDHIDIGQMRSLQYEVKVCIVRF